MQRGCSTTPAADRVWTGGRRVGDDERRLYLAKARGVLEAALKGADIRESGGYRHGQTDHWPVAGLMGVADVVGGLRLAEANAVVLRRYVITTATEVVE